MNNIFWGMLFIFLDFHLEFGGSKIGLIPDFIGYILIAYGIRELTTGRDRFSRMRTLAVVLTVYNAALYAMDFLGMSISLLPEVSIVLGLASLLASLYFSYNIVMGIKDLEAALEQDIGARRLYTVWTISAILSLAIYVLILIPVLNVLSIIAGLIVGIVFLVYLYRAKKLYYGV